MLLIDTNVFLELMLGHKRAGMRKAPRETL